ncbi:MAG TPA: translocation/assembly module TamB domain-containing protein, partial [Elusimicrobiota bacterium]|nr:translocation/assembly module TamB domain-containing protein [Elusimicrobiota bacterium]
MAVLRFALRLLQAAGVVAALLALLLLSLLLEPQWYLTSKTVGWGLRTFGTAYRPGWTAFDFTIRSRDPLEKEVTIAASEFCFAKTDRSLSGCFKTIDARFAFALSPSGVRLTDVSRFVIDGESLRVDRTRAALPPAAAPRGRPAFDPFALPRLVPAAVSGLSLAKARVELPSVELDDSSATAKGSLRLDFDPARAAPLSLDARWRRRPRRGAPFSGRARLDVASDLFRAGRLTYADATGSVRAADASFDFTAKARQLGPDAVAVDARASGRAAGASFRLDAAGVESAARLALQGSFRAGASTGPVRGVRLSPVTVSFERAPGGAAAGRLRADARLRAELAPLPEFRGFKPPQFITGRARVDARLAPDDDQFDAALSILLNPYESWYEAHADAFVRVSGRLSDRGRLKVRQRVDGFAAVPRFEDLVAYLSGGPFAVPAPIAEMKGGVAASVTARGEPGDDRVDFDYSARAALGGTRQKLKLHAAGTGSASGLRSRRLKIAARAALTFDDAALQLPHLSALKIPRMTLDPRIKTPGTAPPPPAKPEEPGVSTAPAASSTTVDLVLAVNTARPIVLYTDLARTPVPLALKLKIAKPPGAASGDVMLEAFDVEFFRRRAQVDHLTLTLAPGSRKTALDGLIKYKAPEALISIRLLGTTDKPRVVFESDPPLSENDIVALLVFGKSPNELDADQSATVSNTQT